MYVFWILVNIFYIKILEGLAFSLYNKIHILLSCKLLLYRHLHTSGQVVEEKGIMTGAVLHGADL